MTKGQHYRRRLNYTFNRLGHGVYIGHYIKINNVRPTAYRSLGDQFGFYESKLIIIESILGFKLF